jgi:tripartite-type tricarboxylate transporter receptor subunit TctC
MIYRSSRRIASMLTLTMLAFVLAACVDNADDAGSGGAGAGGGADAANWKPEFVGGKLQPLPDGFPNQPITIVSVDEPGSRDGIYARNLDQALASISPVEILVSDEPHAAGGTLADLVDTKRRPGGLEGYFPVITSIMGTATDWHTEPVEKEYGISIDDVNFFIATETHPWVIAQRSDAPWGASFEGFISYGKEHPGELRYIAGETGGGSDIALSWMLDGLGVEVKKIPAGGRPAAIAAVGAREGDFTITQPAVADSAGDRVQVIYATTEEVPEAWSSNPGVGSANDLATHGMQNLPWGTVQGLMLPREVPELHVKWLHALFAAAVETDVYKARTKTNIGMQIGLLSTEEANKRARDAYTVTEPIVRAAGLHWEQQ